MKTRKILFALLAGAVLASGISIAEQTVYRWVDENGVIHLSDEPPEGVEAEEISAPDLKAEAADGADSAPKPMMQAKVPLPTPKEYPFGDKSLADLEGRCEAARAARDRQCESENATDTAQCEPSDQQDDSADELPECVEYHNELSRRNGER